MKIILDTLGGDLGFVEHVAGAVEALKVRKDFSLVLVGNKEDLDKELAKYSYDTARIETVNSTEVITCEDAPMEAIRRKTDSSLIVAYKHLKENEEIKALVSTGSTGAVLAGGIFIVIGFTAFNLAGHLISYPVIKKYMIGDTKENEEGKK